MLRYIHEGTIKIDKSRNTVPITFHDSCNYGRSCGMTEEPRELLQLVCSDYREMYPNRAENYCCTGGGGAMSMSEYTRDRLKSAKIKAEQLKATGAKIVVTTCHNCVDGLNDLIKHYKLDMEVRQCVNLVADALVIEKKVAVPVAEPVMAGDLAGFKILVIDDEPDFVTFVATVLEDNGASVITAHDVDSGMQMAKNEMPDLVTLDLNMPGKTGDKAYEQMRDDPKLKTVPVCIITGMPELRRLIYDRPVPPPEGYLDKPVSENKLLMNVKKILKPEPQSQSPGEVQAQAQE
jgi:CheY-like chemotaxis protein